MPRPPAARDKVLDAFAAIVAEAGEQAATMDAVAARAGVSKGGLLYHFGSREALVDGLLDRLAELGGEDVALMREAPEGPVDYYLRTSAESPSDLNELYIAASRLTQTGADRARKVLNGLEDGWYAALLDVVGDPAMARILLLIGDGLYLRAMRGQQAEAVGSWREIEPEVRRWLGPDQPSSARN
ncbi:TetR/AcrR family transcriptional regulator [Naumannella huperziae]